jgi:uncharacterized Zn-finger protein
MEEVLPKPEIEVEITRWGKTYTCTRCQKAFDSNYHVKRHITAVHLRLRAFHCIYCPLRFNLLYDLQVHMRNQHRDMVQ